MRASNLGSSLLAPILLAASAQPAAACDDQALLGATEPLIQQMYAGGGIHVATPGDNMGWYSWSAELNKHVLVASYFDASVFFQPPAIQQGDIVEHVGGVVGGVEFQEGCAPLPTLPSVEVSTSLPSRTFLGGGFLRTISYGGSGGSRIAISQGGTPVPNNPANPEYADCRSDPQSRLAHAHRDVAPFAAFRWNAQRPLDRGELVKVTYDDGGSEVWRAVGGIPSATAWSVAQEPVKGSLKCP